MGRRIRLHWRAMSMGEGVGTGWVPDRSASALILEFMGSQPPGYRWPVQEWIEAASSRDIRIIYVGGPPIAPSWRQAGAVQELA